MAIQFNTRSDEFLGDEDVTEMEAGFAQGMTQQQGTLRGSAPQYERTSVNQSAGLSQPVANGTRERITPPVL